MCAGNNWSIIVKSYQEHFYYSTLPLTTAEELQEFGVGAVFSVQFAGLKKCGFVRVFGADNGDLDGE